MGFADRLLRMHEISVYEIKQPLRAIAGPELRASVAAAVHYVQNNFCACGFEPIRQFLALLQTYQGIHGPVQDKEWGTLFRCPVHGACLTCQIHFVVNGAAQQRTRIDVAPLRWSMGSVFAVFQSAILVGPNISMPHCIALD